MGIGSLLGPIGSAVGAIFGAPTVGGAIGSGLGSLIGSKDSTKDQVKQQNNALALQQKMYEESVARQEPWLQAGRGALGQLSTLYNLPYKDESGNTITPTGEDRTKMYQGFYESPDYAFAMDQGTSMVDRSMAAKGLTNSGASQKALTKYGQGLASQYLQNYAGRLASIAGLGQSAGTTMGAASLTNAAQQGQYMGNIGDIRASGYDQRQQEGNDMTGNLLFGGEGGSSLLSGLQGMFGGTQPGSNPAAGISSPRYGTTQPSWWGA